MINRISVKTVDQLLKQARFRESYKVLPHGKTFKDLSTAIVIPVPGNVRENKFLNCLKCKHKNEYERMTVNGLNPIVVESWKRMVKPMNVPIVEMLVAGYEVGDAYNNAIKSILDSPGLKGFKYLLTMEYDNIVPFIPNSGGPLMMLYECIEKGFDVAAGLYWTKGDPSMPLIFGNPKDKRKSQKGYFKVRTDWKTGDIVECNGAGMGFTLFKMDLFRDSRITEPWFKTVSENTENSAQAFTQDLYFFQKIRAFGYRVCVDTRVRLGHIDFKTGRVY